MDYSRITIGWQHTFPDLLVAETEIALRVVKACRQIGCKCIVFTNDLMLLNSDTLKVERQLTTEEITSMTFVIINHHMSPKKINKFTFSTLWLPADYYTADSQILNVLGCDALLTTGTTEMPDFFKQKAAKFGRNITICPVMFNLGLSHIFLEPCTSFNTLFYCGTNWEYLNPHKSPRYVDVFRKLDSQKRISIYGPETLRGIPVWKGYTCYKGCIPFDGTSVVQHIHESGIALCLVTKEHAKSNINTCRIYEAIAAGAAVITNYTHFCKEYFGDNIFIIDETKNYTDEIIRFVDYIQNPENKEEVITKIKNTQEIFRKHFWLSDQIKNIINWVVERKLHIPKLFVPTPFSRISNNFILSPTMYLGR